MNGLKMMKTLSMVGFNSGDQEGGRTLANFLKQLSHHRCGCVDSRI